MKPKLTFETAKLNIRLIPKITKIEETENYEDSKYSNKIVNHFFKERAKIPNFTGVITKQERIKNIYLGKLFYRKLKERTLDIDFEEGVNIDEFYNQLMDPEFIKDKISFMFKYADNNILSFYSQTINGAIGFYFKHYSRLKLTIDTPSLTSDEKQLLASIRQWKKEDAINVFLLFIGRLYCYVSKESYPYQQIFYRYVKYVRLYSDKPKIISLAIENNQVLRGLLLEFKQKFIEFSLLKAFDLKEFFDYEQFEKICEESGVEFESSIFENKELNDIISDAMYKFFKVS